MAETEIQEYKLTNISESEEFDHSIEDTATKKDNNKKSDRSQQNNVKNSPTESIFISPILKSPTFRKNSGENTPLNLKGNIVSPDSKTMFFDENTKNILTNDFEISNIHRVADSNALKKSNTSYDLNTSTTKFLKKKYVKPQQYKLTSKDLESLIRQYNKTESLSIDFSKLRPAILNEDTYEPLEISDEVADVKNLDKWQLDNKEKKCNF